MRNRPRLKRDGAKPKTGIVHFGPGAFFRAFNAVYTHEAIENAGGDWGIIAVSLRSTAARDQLLPQGGVYTSVTRTQSGTKHEIIGPIADVKVAAEDPFAVLDAMTDPSVKIVSLTITEKGYCHEPATGRLNLDHPDVIHDLAHADSPQSAIGFIVSALARRRKADFPGFTVLSCDNLPSNGQLVRELVLEFARIIDGQLAEWIEQNASFPATMVDRITPATTDQDIETLGFEAGYYDPACVAHEAFRQWVIEDNFVGGRPAWETAGAQFVTSVGAHETMKLRCLNGTHSALAYLGYLAGYETISECVADRHFASLCEKLWHNEIIPTLQQPHGEDLGAYCDGLLQRYRDPTVRHRTWQIAMDGSQKLPQRILGTITDNLAKGFVPPGLCLVVAGWMRYIGGHDESGGAIDVRDPLAGRIKDICEGASDTVNALLTLEEVFPQELADSSEFQHAVAAAYRRLVTLGARASVAEFIKD
ncbi:MAG: mannitol dehydrogenase family protein [Pseudomonadota bacterium]